MALSIDIDLLPPMVVLTANASQQGIEFPPESKIKFGLVQQTNPYCTRVGEGQYCMFIINAAEVFTITGDTTQYFMVREADIISLESEAPPPS